MTLSLSPGDAARGCKARWRPCSSLVTSQIKSISAHGGKTADLEELDGDSIYLILLLGGHQRELTASFVAVGVSGLQSAKNRNCDGGPSVHHKYSHALLFVDDHDDEASASLPPSLHACSALPSFFTGLTLRLCFLPSNSRGTDAHPGPICRYRQMNPRPMVALQRAGWDAVLSSSRLLV